MFTRQSLRLIHWSSWALALASQAFGFAQDSVDALKTSIEKHPYLKKLTWEVDASHSPFVFLVEAGPDGSTFPKDVIRQAPQMLDRSWSAFMDIVESAPEFPKWGTKSIAIIVLRDHDSYLEYWDRGLLDGPTIVGGDYNTLLNASVCYWTNRGSLQNARCLVYTSIHQFFHKQFGRIPMPTNHFWIQDGLATYLSAEPEGDFGGDPRSRLTTLLTPLIDQFGRSKSLPPTLIGLEDILFTLSHKALRLRLWDHRRETLRTVDSWQSEANAVFRSCAALLCHFLIFEAEREETLYDALSEIPSNKPSAMAFSVDEIRTLEPQFFAFIEKGLLSRVPDGAIAQELFRTWTDLPRFGEESSSDEFADGQTARPESSGSLTLIDYGFNPQSLAPVSDFESLMARALTAASKNSTEDALSYIKQSLALLPTAPQREFAMRNLDRFKQTETLVLGILTGFQDAKAKFRASLGDKKYLGTVEWIKDGEVCLKRRADDSTTFTLSSIDVSDAVEQAKKRRIDIPNVAVCSFVKLLRGDSDWDRDLDSNSNDSKTLMSDAPSIGEYLAQGQFLDALEELSKITLPLEDDTDASAILTSIQGLLAPQGLSVDDKGVDNLRQLAIHVLAFQFGQNELEALALAGKIETLGKGRISITYEFDEPSEIGDFERVEGFDPSLREQAVPLSITPEDSHAVIDRGDFMGIGQIAFKHRLEFEAPMSIEIELTLEEVIGDDVGSAILGRIYFCSKFRGQGITVGPGAITAYCMTPHHFDQVSNDFFFPNSKYRLSITHDGEAVVRTDLDNKDTLKVTAGPCKSGEVYLVIHNASPVRFHRFVIEGKLSKKALSQARDTWIENTLVEMGF